MNTPVTIAIIAAVSAIIVTARICATIDRATAAPKVIKLAFEKAGTIGFEPKGDAE